MKFLRIEDRSYKSRSFFPFILFIYFFWNTETSSLNLPCIYTWWGKINTYVNAHRTVQSTSDSLSHRRLMSARAPFQFKFRVHQLHSLFLKFILSINTLKPLINSKIIRRFKVRKDPWHAAMSRRFFCSAALFRWNVWANAYFLARCGQKIDFRGVYKFPHK